MLREWARDTDFLNLFCYTGSATVYAAAGGAPQHDQRRSNPIRIWIGPTRTYC